MQVLGFHLMGQRNYASVPQLGSVLLSFHNASDLRSEFAEPVDSRADEDLRYCRLISLDRPFGISWVPLGGQGCRAEGADIGHELWPPRFLGSVVGYEVPNNGVPGTRPEAYASAAVVPRFPSNQAVSH